MKPERSDGGSMRTLTKGNSMASNRALDRAFVGAAAFLSVLATLAPGALAQEKAAATAAKAPADGAQRAAATMERARAAYTALKAYHETATIKYAIEVEGGVEQPQMSVTTEISAAPGHKLRLTSDQIEIISDGTKAWVVSPARKEYIEQAIEGDVSPQELAQVLPEAGYAIPPTAQILWRADKPLALLTHQITKVTDAKSESRGGEAGTRVTGEGTWEGNDDAVVKVSLWFSDKTGLLGEYVIDLTDMVKKQTAEMGGGDDDEAPPKIKSAQFIHIFENVKIDAGAGDASFAYKAPEDFKKVDEFKELRGPSQGDQMAMLGKPAPQIAGKTLDDKDFSLEGLKGKVVMLDFWATWCGPCVAAIPHIQTLSEKYADKGVVIIGINQDQGDKAKVTKFMEKKKITIRQYMDDGSVGQKYGVTGIPCMVLLDKKGNVQEIKVGYGEGEEDELAKDLDLLIDGKDIHSAEEIAQLQKEAAEGGDDDNAPAPVMGGKREANPLADINPERLVPKETVRTQAYFYGANARRVDVDGDGKLELVAPGMMGGLDILSADGSSVKHVQFEGQPQMSSVSALEPVMIGGALHWLVGTSSYSMGTGAGISIGLYKADGTKVWTYTPQGAEKLVGQVCLSVGDLDGDSRPEVAAGISLMKMDMSGRGRSGPTMCGSSVVVLDLDGKELVRRDLKGQVSMVSIGTPAKAGDVPSLTCFVDGKLTRFTYSKDAKPQAAVGEKP